jgi:hypothetical protein
MSLNCVQTSNNLPSNINILNTNSNGINITNTNNILTTNISNKKIEAKSEGETSKKKINSHNVKQGNNP